MKGFKEFIMRGNVIELAVAVVIGAAFGAIVTALVKGVINPLIGLFGTNNLDQYTTCLKGTAAQCVAGKGVQLLWGSVLGAALNFVFVATAIYFLVVLPMNKLNERRRRGQEPTAQPTELEVLTEIRDLLRQRQS